MKDYLGVYVATDIDQASEILANGLVDSVTPVYLFDTESHAISIIRNRNSSLNREVFGNGFYRKTLVDDYYLIAVKDWRKAEAFQKLLIEMPVKTASSRGIPRRIKDSLDMMLTCCKYSSQIIGPEFLYMLNIFLSIRGKAFVESGSNQIAVLRNSVFNIALANESHFSKHTVQTDNDGEFILSGIVPGEYELYTLQGVDQDKQGTEEAFTSSYCEVVYDMRLWKQHPAIKMATTGKKYFDLDLRTTSKVNSLNNSVSSAFKIRLPSYSADSWVCSVCDGDSESGCQSSTGHCYRN